MQEDAMMRFSALLLSALLLAAAPALAEPKVYSNFPTGEGDPDAITCRPPQHIAGERLPGPEVCKTNAVWARYRRDGMDVAPDGVHDVAAHKDNTSRTCRSVGGAGGATSGGGSLAMTCD
jgi:hypothetical protein